MHPNTPRRRASTLFYAAAFSFFILTAGLLGVAAAGSVAWPAQTEMSQQTPLVGVGS
jgi:hypothetical protein